MTASNESTRRSPYPGPRPFEQQEGDLFFGRRREALDLRSLVLLHREVLLYAQAGAGKTSLLNAGLTPLLLKEGFDVLPVARLRGGKPPGLDFGRVSNIYAFNTLVGLTPDTDPAALISTTLDEWFAGQPHGKDEFGDDRPRILIIDQFEEFFTAYPEYAKHREAFIRQIARALEADPLLRVLFAIREEYLASIDTFVILLPEHLRARYRMERLGPEAASAAVAEAASALGLTFTKDASDRLVAQLLLTRVEDADGNTLDIPGEYVDPVQLQVVCRRLWDMLPADVKEINAKHIGELGNVDDALSEFYETALKQAVSEPQITEKMLRTWFEKKLITPSGTRSTVRRNKDDTGGLPNVAIDRLDRAQIIRFDQRGGARWYELTHDRLIRPILESNQRHYEARADDWAQHGRRDSLLLPEADLAEAQDCVNRGWEVSDLLKSYVSASRVKLERDKFIMKARPIRRMRNLAFVAAAFAALVALFALSQLIRANSRTAQRDQYWRSVRAKSDSLRTTNDTLRLKRALADSALLIAESLATVANSERQKAESQKELAEANLSRALKAESLAELRGRAADANRLADAVGVRMDYADEEDTAFANQDSLRKAIGESPESPRPHALLGVSLVDDSPDVAIAELNKAVNTPQFAEGYAYRCTLARLYVGMGDTNSAIPNLEVAIKQNPEFSDAQDFLGAIYRNRGEYALAIPCFKAAFQRTSDSANIMLELGEAYLLSRQFDSALKWLNSVETDTSYSRPPHYYLLLSAACDSTGQRDRSAACLDTAVLQYCGIADECRRYGWYARARECADRAHLLRPQSGVAIRELAWVAYSSDDSEWFDPCITLLDSAQTREPDPANLELLGLLYREKGQHDMAKTFMLRTLREDSSRVHAWQVLGEIYHEEEANKYDSAYLCLSIANAWSSYDYDLMSDLAEASLTTGRFKPADSLVGELREPWRWRSLSCTSKLAMDFISLSARLLRGDTPGARDAIDSLSSDYRQFAPDSVTGGWMYKGTRHFIETSRHLTEEHRRLLLDVLNDYLDPASGAQPSEPLERLKERI